MTNLLGFLKYIQNEKVITLKPRHFIQLTNKYIFYIKNLLFTKKIYNFALSILK